MLLFGNKNTIIKRRRRGFSYQSEGRHSHTRLCWAQNRVPNGAAAPLETPGNCLALAHQPAQSRWLWLNVLAKKHGHIPLSVQSMNMETVRSFNAVVWKKYRTSWNLARLINSVCKNAGFGQNNSNKRNKIMFIWTRNCKNIYWKLEYMPKSVQKLKF